MAQSIGYIPPHSTEGLPDGTAVRTGIHLQQKEKEEEERDEWDETLSELVAVAALNVDDSGVLFVRELSPNRLLNETLQ